MEKSKPYRNIFFKASVLKTAIERIAKLADQDEPNKHPPLKVFNMKVFSREESWNFDDLEEFLSVYKPTEDISFFWHVEDRRQLSLRFDHRITDISVTAPTRTEIETVFNIFEEHVADSKLPELPPKSPVIFIGHGGSSLWRDLKDHLQDKHGYEVAAYEIGSRAGHTIRDILEEMMEKSSVAFLVLTGEDETADNKLLARQNVVHETGLFQGKLGFSRAIVLKEDGTEEFSNLAGIQQIRFSKGNIKETFGEVLAVLRREFNA